MSSVVNILVGRKKVEWIAYNHKISSHAKMQMVRRGAEHNLVGAILNGPLAWKLPDNYIAIAINLFEYVVVATSPDEAATIVTYINLQDDEYSVIDKMLVAYQDAIRAKAKENENGLVTKISPTETR